MPRSSIHLRDATLADLGDLLALEAAFPGDRLSERQYRHHLGNPGARLRVLIADGVSGSSLTLFRRDSARARLYSLVVDPAQRGRGLGARLLADVEAGARARGCLWLGLEVRADNAPALTLYQRAGYRVEARRPGYYQDGQTALRLSKPLT